MRRTFFKALAIVPMFLLLSVVNGYAQGFVYTNNNVLGANSVSAYRSNPDGTLTSVGVFATGGTGTAGGSFSASRLIVESPINLLWAANDGNNTVSAFSINPTTGNLTAIAGSPFATGLTNANGLSLALTPDRKFLIAGGNSDFSVFSVGSNGALSSSGTASMPSGLSISGMDVSPNGKFLAAASSDGGGFVVMFDISTTGSLSLIGTFADGSFGAAASVVFNSASSRLYVGEGNQTDTIVVVFDVSTTGVLTPIAGSPFHPIAGVNSTVVLLSPDERFLFVSNQFSDSVTVFNVLSDGGLSLLDAYTVGCAGCNPAGLAVNRTGTRLYTGNYPNTIGGFVVNSNGTLTRVSFLPLNTGRTPGLTSIAFYDAPLATVTTVTATPRPSVFGQDVTFTATVTSGGTAVTQGSITFREGPTVLSGPTALNGSGQATFNKADLNSGNHTITAQYSGGGFFSASSGSITQTVNQANTTTTVASSVNPSEFGQSVTFSATVAAVFPGAGTPTGSVQFKDGGVNIGGAVTLSNGIASVDTASLSAGSHSITADYNDDNNFNPSSGGVTQTVNKQNTATTATASVNPSVFGQSVTFTATVTADGALVTEGSVTFKEGQASLAGPITLDANGQASFSTNTLIVGSHTIVAECAGSSNFNGSNGPVTQTVNKADTRTSVTSDPNRTSIGQSVTFVAAVTSDAGQIVTGSVTFQEGTTILGGPLALDSNGRASFATAALTEGTSTIRAEYSGDNNFNSSASEVQHHVDGPPSVSAGESSSVAEGASVVLSAVGTDPAGGDLVYEWDLDGNGTFETSGRVVTFSAAGLDGPSSRIVTVRATNAAGLSATAQATVNVLNAAPVVGTLTPGTTSILENDAVTLSGDFTDPSALDVHTVVINWGDGSAPTSLALSAGVRNFSASHQYVDDAPSNTPADVNAISVSISDDDGGIGTGASSVTVSNRSPVISSVTAPAGPVAPGSPIGVNVAFADVGSLDTHTCTFSWGDSATTAVPATGTCSATHAYAETGLYTIGIVITDDDTGSASASHVLTVAIDSEGGSVTGGGSIDSPRGAYALDPNATGKATFGFVARFEKRSTVPTGQTEFQLHGMKFDFHSTVYESLVVSGNSAQYGGEGTLNGQGGYRFLMRATDGDLEGGDGVDRLALTIWDSAGAVVYNNDRGTSGDAVKGQIQIHRP